MGIESLIETLVENGASLTQLFQSSFPFLLAPMQAINLVTEPEVCFLLLIAIYWGINRDKGSNYTYLLGLTLVIFSIFQHILQFPAPFWLDGNIMQAESGSFASPNLNTAIALLLLLPFKRFLRTDLAIPSFLLVSFFTGLSQVYLGLAGIPDVILGFLTGSTLILIWRGWNRRYGKRFSQRILGQRFWAAILFPAALGFAYFLLIRWTESIAYTGFSNVDEQLHWRAWQTGFINTVTALTILTGIGTGIALESSRIRFRPINNGGSLIINWGIGFSILGGLLYFFETILSTEAFLQTGGPFAITLIALKTAVVILTAIYLIPWLFTMIGTATSKTETVPTISLNNFSVER